jgi:thiol-disulfide isomerase/thioredoxin
MFLQRRFVPAVLMLSLSSLLPILYSAYVHTSPEQYTHNVLVEYLDNVYCGICKGEAPILNALYKELRGAYIPVAYHTLDEWATNASLQMIEKFRIASTPYHVFDGGFFEAGGEISKRWIDKAGTRPVHRIELTVKKTVSQSNLTYYGHVRELDNQPFAGHLRVFIVENKINAQNIEWNFVFRDFGLEQNISLSPNGYVRFSGSWKPKPEYKADNLMVVASAWGKDEVGRLFSIQATNDEYSGPPIADTTPNGKSSTPAPTPTPTITPIPSPTETPTPPPRPSSTGWQVSQTYLYAATAAIIAAVSLLAYRRLGTRKR